MGDLLVQIGLTSLPAIADLPEAHQFFVRINARRIFFVDQVEFYLA